MAALDRTAMMIRRLQRKTEVSGEMWEVGEEQTPRSRTQAYLVFIADISLSLQLRVFDPDLFR
jgi:hypothetical protein